MDDVRGGWEEWIPIKWWWGWRPQSGNCQHGVQYHLHPDISPRSLVHCCRATSCNSVHGGQLRARSTEQHVQYRLGPVRPASCPRGRRSPDRFALFTAAIMTAGWGIMTSESTPDPGSIRLEQGPDASIVTTPTEQQLYDVSWPTRSARGWSFG